MSIIEEKRKNYQNVKKRDKFASYLFILPWQLVKQNSFEKNHRLVEIHLNFTDFSFTGIIQHVLSTCTENGHVVLKDFFLPNSIQHLTMQLSSISLKLKGMITNVATLLHTTRETHCCNFIIMDKI